MKRSQLQERLDARQTVRRDTLLARTLTAVATLGGDRNWPLMPLRLLSHLPDYIRAVVLRRAAEYFQDGSLRLREGMDPEIHHDFVVLAKDLGLTSWSGDGTLVLAEPYRTAVRGGPAGLREALTTASSGPLAAMCRNEAHIVALINRAESDDVPAFLRRDDVRYLILLARYIGELEGMNFTAQIPPSFGEKFYSDLGELAYELYTSEPYARLCVMLKFKSMLDIGCGEGRHMEAALQRVHGAQAVGLELQPGVAESARSRLSEYPAAEVINSDFFAWQSGEKFDFILACYMLFYLPLEDRVPFFSKVADSLSTGGTFVICQYFPDIELIQDVMVQDSATLPGLQRYLTGVGMSLCRAEVLLNRVLHHFNSIVYWDEMVDQLDQAGLVVDELLPADSMYYSYFVLVKHRGAGRESAHAATPVAAGAGRQEAAHAGESQ